MYNNNTKRNRETRRNLLVAMLIVLTVFVTVGSTLAYFTDIPESITNIFTPSKVTTAVVEQTVGNPYSGIKIANTNNTQAYIRAAIVVTWQDAAGNVFASAPVEGTDYELNFIGLEKNGGWFKGDDGYYYYENPVDPVPENGTPYTTSILFNDLRQISTAPFEGFSINVEVLGSGIQSTPEKVVEEVWGVSVTDGTLTLGK